LKQSPGTTATFSIKASGTGLFYEWQKDGIPLLAGGRITGQGTSRVNIRTINTEDGGLYSCRVSWVASSGQTLDSASVVAGNYELIPLEGKPEFLRPLALPAARVGANYEYQLPTQSDPNKAPFWFKATGLPPGLVIDAVTGVLKGRPISGREAPYVINL
jgi:hypothetical protein